MDKYLFPGVKNCNNAVRCLSAVCFFTIKVTVLTFIISTFPKKKTNKQVLNNLLRIEQNVKRSKLKNPVRDLTLNNPVRAEGMPLAKCRVITIMINPQP